MAVVVLDDCDGLFGDGDEDEGLLGEFFGDVAWGNKDKLPEASVLGLIETFSRLNLSPSEVDHAEKMRRRR